MLWLLSLVVFLFVDHTKLIDPQYYISAAQASVDIKSAISQNARWGSDVLFSFIIGVLGIAGANGYFVFSFFIILHFLILLGVIWNERRKRLTPLLALCLIFNITYFTGVFNVWRQSLVEVIFLYALTRREKLKTPYSALIPSLGLHAVSAVIYFWVHFLIDRVILVFFITGASLALAYAYEDQINLFVAASAYGVKEGEHNPQRLIIIFFLILLGQVAKPHDEKSSKILTFIFYIFALCLLLYNLVPYATDRILRIVFLVYPLIFLYAKSRREVSISSVALVLYFLLNIYFISRSQTFALVSF